jgi:hypothetical protein
MRSKITAAVVVPLTLGSFALAIGHGVGAATSAKSQNGWTVVEKSGTDSYQVPGSKVKLRVRKGDVATVLLDVAAWFDQNIEDIDKGADDWGWSVRKISGSSTYSNHASGTAIDLNAEKHPMGVATSKGLSSQQINEIRGILKSRYKGVIRWGGDYKSRPDAMHFEINKDSAAVKSLAQSFKSPSKPIPTTTKPPTATTKPPTATTVPPPTVPPEESQGEEDSSEEEMGPVEPQAPVEIPLDARHTEAVRATPAYAG